ncbi:cytochrome P450 [Lentzea sp. NPDC102401]|uniref:cytochrome P450 family protein n=1 Tax=Lentzea sp. NPDC102401 TaxID=3364128 RepID=UPI0038101AD5
MAEVRNVAASMFADDVWSRSEEIFADLREVGAVHRTRLANGMPVTLIVRHREAQAALLNPALGKDADELRAAISTLMAGEHRHVSFSGMYKRNMLNSDAPEHRRLRKLVSSAFTPKRVEALRPSVTATAQSLLDAAQTRSRDTGRPTELMEEFAIALPVMVMCELLGVPHSDRVQFRTWTEHLMRDEPEYTEPASVAMEAYFTELIPSKRDKPGEDLLSALVSASVDSDQLSTEELLGTCFLLIVAGHDTTVNLIGNGAFWLLRHPHRWQQLARTPALVPRAVEELLRLDSPVRAASPRFAREDIDVDGTIVPAGDIVLICLGSANRDGEQFAAADDMRLSREVSAHLAFGHGMHYCLGAAQARMVGDVAFTELVARFPSARLAMGLEDVRRRASSIMNGLHRLPVWLQ